MKKILIYFCATFIASGLFSCYKDKQEQVLTFEEVEEIIAEHKNDPTPLKGTHQLELTMNTNDLLMSDILKLSFDLLYDLADNENPYLYKKSEIFLAPETTVIDKEEYIIEDNKAINKTFDGKNYDENTYDDISLFIEKIDEEKSSFLDSMNFDGIFADFDEEAKSNLNFILNDDKITTNIGDVLLDYILKNSSNNETSFLSMIKEIETVITFELNGNILNISGSGEGSNAEFIEGKDEIQTFYINLIYTTNYNDFEIISRINK